MNKKTHNSWHKLLKKKKSQETRQYIKRDLETDPERAQSKAKKNQVTRLALLKQKTIFIDCGNLYYDKTDPRGVIYRFISQPVFYPEYTDLSTDHAGL